MSKNNPKYYFTNAFSVNMFQSDIADITLDFQKITQEEAISWLENRDFIYAVGHQDTANVIQSVLGVEKNPFNRISVEIDHWDTVIVAQYRGPRLPEGATTLPENATIEFWLIY